ncbi:MAG: hypothetical protein OFPII_03830 [Osedax symbiont Rs1]|nr:MAG: hypothetical protein OFPII_03830 [Osedax symbiont Rs1]
MKKAQQLLLSLHKSGVQLYLNEQQQLAFRSNRILKTEEKTEIRACRDPLIALLASARAEHSHSAEVTAKATKPTLSCNQQSLCFICQDETLNLSYLITFALAFNQKPDLQRLQLALQRLQDEQPALRSGFSLQQGQFEIVREARVALPWQQQSLSSSQNFEDWLDNFGNRAIGIEQAPLWRLCLVEQGGQSWLAVKVHHLIWDGWSSDLFRRLLQESWQQVGELNSSIHEQLGLDWFSKLQREKSANDGWQQGLAYWQKKLRDAPLQACWTERITGQGAGPTAHCSCQLEPLAGNLNERYLQLLAAWLLAQAWCFAEDSLVCGVPVANRHHHACLEQALGYFNNTIPIVATDLLSSTPQMLLAQLTEQWQQSLAMQDVPFDRIVSACLRSRSDGINPVFQTFFAYQGFDWKQQHGHALSHRLVTVPSPLAKFPLVMQVAELDQGLTATIEYDINLFSATEIEQLLQGWQQWLERLSSPLLMPLETIIQPEATCTAALIKGETLQLANNLPTSLPDALRRTAAQSPQRGLRFIEADGIESWLSYAQLYRDASAAAAGFQLGSVWSESGRPVIVLSDQLESYIKNFWAVMLAGGIPVTIAAADSYSEARNGERLLSVWQHLKQPVVVCDAQCAAKLQPLLQAWPEMSVQVPQANTAELQPVLRGGDQLAILQLSSGSTGTPKCIQQSHQAIIQYSSLCAHSRGYRGDQISLNWLSFDHVGGLLFTHLRDVCLAREQIHLATRWVLEDPLRWPLTMAKYGVTHSWSPNFGYKLIASVARQQPERKADLSSVVELINGGEMVVADTLRDLNDAFAHWQLSPRAMTPAFGMAECCTVIAGRSAVDLEQSLLTSEQITLGAEQSQLGMSQFVSLGPVMAETEIRIVDDQDQLLNEYQVGRFQIRGCTVTSGYYGAETATGKALLEDGWFDTGDLALLANGELYMTGRGEEMIVLNGTNFFSHELEACVEQIVGVRATWVAAVGYQQGDKEAAALCYVAETGVDIDALNHQIRLQLASRMQFYPERVEALLEADFPKTVSGKIQRRQLVELLLARAKADQPVALRQLAWQPLEMTTASTGRWGDWCSPQQWAASEGLILAVCGTTDSDLLQLRDTLLEGRKRWQGPILLCCAEAQMMQLHGWTLTLAQEYLELTLSLVVCDTQQAREFPILSSDGLYRWHDQSWQQFDEQSFHLPIIQERIVQSSGYSLVTGATGGIAGELIPWLCQQGQTLVLLSRGAVDTDFQTQLARDWPGQCHWLCCDFSQLENLQQVWKELPEKLQTSAPEQIYHLAGNFSREAVATLEVDGLAAARAGRVQAARVLQALLQTLSGSGDSCWFHCSSLNGWRGGPGMAAYNQACGQLRDFAAEQRLQGYSAWWFGFSAWQDIGMSRNNVDPQQLAAAGLQMLLPQQALTTLAQLQQQPAADYLIGAGSPPQQRSSGRRLPEQLPAALQDALCLLVSHVLNLSECDPKANFFDLGGSSLELIQLQRLIQQRLQLNLDITTVLQYPSVTRLCRYLQEQKVPAPQARRGRRSTHQRRTTRTRN